MADECTINDTVIITQGEKAEFDMFLERPNTLPRPYPLTNFTKFKLCLPKTDGNWLEITEVANANGSQIDKTGDDVSGQLHVIVGKVDTALLQSGYQQDVCLSWDNAGETNTKKKNLKKFLNVEECPCA